ncbi:MAG TPA: bifunctional oligoribonuclease/PAP phosphatase NrnA [Tenuifilaceae bacterium]|nr:bifunctional oligoribonuclease/PAP phosphatase NrnA [Tenuifilaceae bacterium]HPE17970.1 bifunctional oligoribonuclease/PAP phosphatase NrnA [Tenuifilaceae bacterium]HPJ44908.1 bifunctional oligoribonuclease/PAP phosphatase NrnA [Tenuifilaceae bacterium]HPQ33126.1 bifunctional oligoribonuclease/PAP phosphatase NrnA [Tenuifilaceae bacterium]HRX67058.1 bifunctional oligoribonuclease/PAP phosphatase NrnA [Tenuifilaceae bacterium]
MSESFESKVNTIRSILANNSGQIVITSHHNPDGDAIGSMLGLFHVLKCMGYEATMISPNGFPDFLAWIEGSTLIQNFSRSKKKLSRTIQDAGIIFSLDYNGFARLEDMEEAVAQSSAKKIMIDHHPNPENTFDVIVSDVNVSSTAELVYEVFSLICESEIISIHAATSIYVGIMTDTGSFSYGCSRPRTFEIAAQLIAKGVDIEKAQQQVYNNFSESRMRLLGFSLSSKMKVFPELRSAYISLTRNELKQFNYAIGDTEGLVNYPLSIKNIVFSVLFVENEGFVKVSLRSRGNFPVNQISQKHYQGGGHKNAAGGKSFSSLQETEKNFLKVLEEYKNELTQ